MYMLIRWSLLIGLSALGIVVLHKTKIKRKKLISVLSVLWCICLVFLISVFPIENAFVTFDSPESVVFYTKHQKTIKIVHGKESCVAISQTDNSSYTSTFVLKDEDGYKIAYYFSVQQVLENSNGKASFTVYKVRDTQDYYISFTVVGFGSKEIDFYNGNDELIDCEIVNVDGSFFRWIYLDGFSDDYYMTINGEKISLSD